MDRISRIGVVACLAIMIYLAFFALPKTLPKAPTKAVAPNAITPGQAAAPALANTATAVAPTVFPAATSEVPPLAFNAPEQLAYLENAHIKVTLTSLNVGGAIKGIEIKPSGKDQAASVMLNEQARTNIMALSGWANAESAGLQPKQTGNTVLYDAVLPGGVKWQRSYALGTDYVVAVKDTLTNPGTTAVALPAYSLSVGRAEPLQGLTKYRPTSNEYVYLGCGWLTTEHFHLSTISDFNPGSVPLIGIKLHEGKDLFSSTAIENARLRWIGAENQFFTVLLTPSADHLIDHAEFQCYNQRDPERGTVPFPSDTPPDIEGRAFFPGLSVPAGGSVTTAYSVYAGPKDYARLNALGEQQGELMNYGKFEVLILPMLLVLHTFYSWFHNYGVAIILLTLCIKGLTWYPQGMAYRSGKKMQALAPKIKELQAKYKETPEKLNSETFALYKEYGVNPLGGCLPVLIPMPIFFSLYYMLQNAGELRGQSFLWIHDLTQPDTVLSFALPFVIPIFNISHFVLNPLPLMVTGLTMVMMRLSPQMGDPQQAKIAQFMPVIFLVFLYNFAAALSLYYVMNNFVSIIQIYRNLKRPLPELKRAPKKK